MPMSPSRFRSTQHLNNMWAPCAPSGGQPPALWRTMLSEGSCRTLTGHLPGTKVESWHFPAAFAPKPYQLLLKTRQKNQAWEEQSSQVTRSKNQVGEDIQLWELRDRSASRQWPRGWLRGRLCPSVAHSGGAPSHSSWEVVEQGLLTPQTPPTRPWQACPSYHHPSGYQGYWEHGHSAFLCRACHLSFSTYLNMSSWHEIALVVFIIEWWLYIKMQPQTHLQSPSTVVL